MSIYRFACSNIALRDKNLSPIKKLLENIGFYVILSVLIKPVWMIIDIKVHDLVGSETFGRYAALLSLVVTLSVFYDLGINHFSTSSIAGKKSNFGRLFPSLLILRLSVLVLFPFLIVGVGYLMGYRNEDLQWLGMIALAHNLFQCALFFRAKFQSFQRFRLDSIASVLQKLLLITTILVIIYGLYSSLSSFEMEMKTNLTPDLLVYWYIGLEVLSHLVVFVVLFVAVIKLFGWVKLKFDAKLVKKVLWGSVPFAVMTLLYSLNSKLDVLMLDQLFDKEEAGIYTGATRMFEAGMMYPWVLMSMFFAKFAFNKKDSSKQKDLIRVGTLVMFLPMLILGCIFIFAPQPLFILFKLHNSADVERMQLLLGILGGSFIVHSLSVVFGTYLNATGYVKKVNWVVLVSVGFNVILNFFLIPIYGAYAAAWTTTISTVILWIGYLYLLYLKSQFKPVVVLTIKLILMASIVVSVLFVIRNIDLSWYVMWGIIVGLVAIFAYLFGLLKKKMYQLDEN